ncbi:MAG: amino acid permease [Bacteroidetes bacterium]|nr:MAG: amino acid permease [Bacteroidota bacterium]
MFKKGVKESGFGTAPVFFTAIATIFGAILFLRFGYAVGTLGFWGVILIIILGHLLTIPTALAISELATNKRVEGGGEYFIISRSFGLNIGATIGIALFLSQAISIAFYVIAFTEAFSFFFDWVKLRYDILLPRQVISVPVMLLLALLLIMRGANMGVKALYIVVGILGVSLILFFAGSTEYAATSDFSLGSAQFRNMDNFFFVFAIVFPAFTGFAAGVGLSGELRKPSRSIPLGTIGGTLIGMIVYVFVVYKLAGSASSEDLLSNQLIMSKIAIGGIVIIPLGLAASTISSALGSAMIAPRTLQALAGDESFPMKRINKFLSHGRKKDGEPQNASIVSCVIALVFVMLGNVNAVAEVISMFFLLTYGSLSLISFLNHFGSSPSYRPSFKSKWYLSLIGFLLSVWVMFKIDTPYALASCVIMVAIYLTINYYHKGRKGLEAIFTNSIFQMSRNLQVYLQKNRKNRTKQEWRPSAICISEHSFERQTAFNFLNWISYKYGFGTYIHQIDGYYSRQSHLQANQEMQRLLKLFDNVSNHVYIDTIISPSYSSAIVNAIQVPGIAGMENNMVIFEFDKENPTNLKDIVDNFALVNSGEFDVCIVSSSRREINYKGDIHLWIHSNFEENANLMILLGFIIMGHTDWRKSNIKIFEICKPDKLEENRLKMDNLILTGRMPITKKNIEIILDDNKVSTKEMINQKSADAGLTLIGFGKESLKHQEVDLFTGYDELGTVIFVHAHGPMEIE